MKKKTVLLFFLIALLMPALNSQMGSFSLVIPSVLAGGDRRSHAEEDGSHEDHDHHVTICHFPPSGGEPQSLHVGESALEAHLAHGDTSGECFFCPPGASSCVDSDGDPGILDTSQPESPDSQRAIFGQ